MKRAQNMIHSIAKIAIISMILSVVSGCSIQGNTKHQAAQQDSAHTTMTEQELIDEFMVLTKKANFCASNSDCVNVYPECPLGCGTPVNKSKALIVKTQAKKYRALISELTNTECNYMCVSQGPVFCVKNTCQFK